MNILIICFLILTAGSAYSESSGIPGAVGQDPSATLEDPRLSSVTHQQSIKDVNPAARGVVIATPDGGVIVQESGRLLKYDKDLNVIKEVEINRDLDPQDREDKWQLIQSAE